MKVKENPIPFAPVDRFHALSLSLCTSPFGGDAIADKVALHAAAGLDSRSSQLK